MSPAQETVRLFRLVRAVDAPLALTATMFGLPKATVITIIQIALPLMAQMAETNVELLRRIYATSLMTMPASLPDFYSQMAESRVVRQAIMDDYKATYGTMLDAVQWEAARHAGTTDGQAREVLAAVLPAITHGLAQANLAGSEQGFAQQLKALRS